MADIEHKTITAANVHSPYRWIVADAAARNALTADGSYDRYKICLQEDTGETWRMATTTPPVTWELVADAPGTSAANIATHEAASDPHPGYILETEKAAANGVATLGGDSKIPVAQLPAIAITDYLGDSADQTAMLALSGQKGDWTIRTDLGTVWVITGNDPSVIAGWTELEYPTSPVTSVAGKTGAVTLVANDISNASPPGKALLTAAGVPAQRAALSVREQLTANRTYYVRTDGSDSNDGLANTAGGAFLTPQKAWDVVASLDLAIYTATIQVADHGGTPYAPLSIDSSPVGGAGVIIVGNTVSPTSCVIEATSASLNSGVVTVNSPLSCPLLLEGLTLKSNSSALVILSASKVQIRDLHFETSNAVAGDQIRLAVPGAYLEVTGPYSCEGTAISHYSIRENAAIRNFQLGDLTLISTPSFTNGFLRGETGAVALIAQISFTGSATGPRYLLGTNATVATLGAGDTFFPGNSAGTAETGGVYA